MNWLKEVEKQGKEWRSKVGGECQTPGMKIRSRGLGRGLARGRGRGPIGIPYGGKEEEETE